MVPTSPVTVTARFAQGKSSKHTTRESGCRCTHARLELRTTEHLALLPTVALVMLPKCPLCLAAWLGIFSYLLLIDRTLRANEQEDKGQDVL